MTISGLKSDSNRFAFHKEDSVLPAVTKVSKDNLRCNPCTGNVVNGIPSLGTMRDSSPLSVPT